MLERQPSPRSEEHKEYLQVTPMGLSECCGVQSVLVRITAIAARGVGAASRDQLGVS